MKIISSRLKRRRAVHAIVLLDETLRREDVKGKVTGSSSLANTTSGRVAVQVKRGELKNKPMNERGKGCSRPGYSSF